MCTLTIFDPSIFSRNLGDDIIMDFCIEELSKLFPDKIQVRLPTHQSPSRRSLYGARHSLYKIVCGTNLLSSNIVSYNQWKCDLIRIKYIKGALLMGVGWWQYQSDPTILTRRYYKHILHPEMLHSVRDTYTERKMQKMGFRNIINTGCPTTWKLTESLCQTIPTNRSDAVLFTITDYKQNLDEDLRFVNLLCENYDRLFFWPQGLGDVKYINMLFKNITRDIKFVGANLFQLKKFMEDNDFDYIGTRLHAGILSINHRRRTMIIGVDNRAIEMKNDINLPVVSRGDLKGLKTFIQNKFITEVRIKNDHIDLWRDQFK